MEGIAYIILLLIVFPSILAQAMLEVGYISQSAAPGSNDPVFEDFKIQIENLYGGNVNFTREEINDNGNDYDMILKKFKDKNIYNLFSAVDFKNWTNLDESLKKNELLLWSSIPKQPSVCYKNIYSYLSLLKYYERLIVYYSEERPIAIVYEENNRFKSIVEVIKNYVYILGVEIAKDGVSYSYKYANPLPPNGKSVSEWISSLDQKFVILLVVGNANLNAILTDIEANVVDNIHKYVLLENEDFNYFNSPPALSGFSFGLDIVTVYDHSKAVTEIYDLNNVTQKENAVKIVKLCTLFKVLYYSFSRSQSSTAKSILYAISNRKVLINGRNILIPYSHIIPSPLFITTYDTSDPTQSAISVVLEIDEYFLYSDIMGRPQLTCIFKTAYEVERPTELVVFIHYLSDNEKRDPETHKEQIAKDLINERLILEAELLALKSVETQPKLPNNLRLTPLIIDGSRGIQMVMQLLMAYSNALHLHYIFTTFDNEDREELLVNLRNYLITDIEIVSMKHLTGLECVENSIFSGISAPAKFDIAYSWYLRDSDLPIVIIGSDKKYGKSTSEYFYNQFNHYGYDMDKIFLYQMKDKTYSEGFNAVSKIRSFLFDPSVNTTASSGPYGYAIICLEEQYLDQVLHAYRTLKLNSKFYQLMLLEYDEFYPYKDGEDGEYIYFSVIDQHIDTIPLIYGLQMYGRHRVTQLTTAVVVGYYGVNFLIQSIRSAMSTSFTDIRKMFLNVHIAGSGGAISLSRSGYTFMKLNIRKRVGSDAYEYPHTAHGSFQVYIFKEDTSTYCDLSNYYIKGGNLFNNIKKYILVALYPTSVYDKMYMRDMTELTIIACDMINAYGGALNGLIIPSFVRYKRTIDEVEKMIDGYLEDPLVIGFIGILTRQEREYLNPKLVRYDKVLLLPFPFEVADNSLNIAFDFMFLESTNCVVYYVNNTITLSMIEYIEAHLKKRNLGDECIYIEYSSETSIDNLTETCKNYNNSDNGGFIFTLLNDDLYELIESFPSECNNNPKIKFYHYYFSPRDITIERYNKDNVTNLNGHIVVGSYYRFVDTKKAKIMESNIEQMIGLPEVLMQEDFLSIYELVSLYGKAMTDKGSTSAFVVLSYFKSLTTETPESDHIMMTNSRYFSKGFYLGEIVCSISSTKCEIEEYKSFPSPILSNGYNSDLKEGEDLVCNLYSSSNDIKGMSIPLHFGVIFDDPKNDHNQRIVLEFRWLESYFRESGLFDGRLIITHTFKCPTTPALLDEIVKSMKENDIKVFIGGCDKDTIDTFARNESLKNSLLFYTGLNTGNICKSNVIFVCPTPDQYISNVMNYLVIYKGNNIALVYDSSTRIKVYADIILNAIGSLNLNLVFDGDIKDKNYTKVIETCIQLVNTLQMNNLYIISLLENEPADYFYNYYHTFFRGEIPIPVYSLMSYFAKIDVKTTENHYVISNRLLPSDDYGLVEKLKHFFGDGYIFNGFETNYLIPFYLLAHAIKDTLKMTVDSILTSLYFGEYDTPFNTLFVTPDNTISHFISVIKKDKNNNLNSAGNVVMKFFEGNVYKMKYYDNILYGCNWKSSRTESYLKSTVGIGILLSLSGKFMAQDKELLTSYLLVVSLINNEYNGVRGLTVSPIIKDIKSDKDEIEPLLSEFKSLGVSIIFGLTNSELRIIAKPIIEENNMLLFYAHDYEGLECSRNIVYIGLPATANEYYPYYMLTDQVKNNINVVIVYTETDTINKIKDVVAAALNRYDIVITKNIPAKYGLKDYSFVMKQLLQYAVPSAIVVTLLEGENVMNFYSMTKGMPLHIYAFGFDKSLISDDNYLLFRGHHIITAESSVDNEMSRLISSYLDSSFPYVTTLSQNMLYSITSVLVWRAALEAKKSVTVDNILTALYNLDVLTPMGLLNINYNHHLNIPRLILTVKAVNGRYQIVEEYRSKFVRPNPWKSPIEGELINECKWDGVNDKDKMSVVQYNANILLSKADPMFLDMVSGVVASYAYISETGGLLGNELNFILFLYDDNDNELYDKLFDYLNRPLRFFLFGCTTPNCKSIIRTILPITKGFLFNPLPSKGEECSIFELTVGPLPNQIVEATINFITSQESKHNVIVLSSPDDTWDVYKDVFIYSLPSQLKVTEYTLGDYEFFSFSDYENVWSDLGDGGIIVSFLSVRPMVSLVEIMSQYSHNFKIFDLITMRVTPTTIFSQYYSDTLPLYYPTVLDIPVKDDPLIERLTTDVYKYSGVDYTTDVTVSSAMCIEGLGKYVRGGGTNDVVELKKIIFSTPLTDDGKNYIDYSFYAVRNIYIYNYTGGIASVAKVLSKSTPQPFNWLLEGNKGKMCDIRNVDMFGNGNPIYRKDVIKILFVVSETGVDAFNYRGMSAAFQEAINQINKIDGVRNKTVEFETMDDESESTKCADIIKSKVSSGEFVAVFTTGDIQCMDLILETVNRYNIKVFQIGLFGGESCENNIIHIGIEPSQMELFIERLLNKGIRSYAIVGVSTSTSIRFSNYAERFINYLHGDMMYSISLDIGVNNTDSIASSIVSRLPSGGAILYFGTAPLHVLLSKSLKKLGSSVDKISFVSFSTAEEVSSQGDILKFYSVMHYFNSIETPENDALIEHLKSPLPSDTVPNHFHEAIYTMLFMWREIANNQLDVPMSELNYYNKEYDSAVGKMKIATNNIIQRKVYIGVYDGNAEGKFAIFSVDDMGRPKVWQKFINSGIYECDLSNPEIGSQYKHSSNKIAVMASLTGGDELKGRELVSATLLAVDEINNDGGLIGEKIEVEVVDIKSDLKTLDRISKETASLKAVTAAFGANWDDEYKIIEPYFSQVEKLYFFPGISTGEFCHQYGIITGVTMNQIISAAKAILTQKDVDYIIMYSDYAFCINALQLLESLFDTLKISYKSIELTDTNINEVTQQMYVDYPNGVYILDISSGYTSVEIAESCIKNGLVYPKFVFYHFIMDEYTISKNKDAFERHILFSSWSSALGTNPLREYEKSREFYQKFVTRFSDTVLVTSAAEAIYVAVKLWAFGVREAFSYDGKVVRDGMAGVRQQIAGGYVKLENNNMLSRKLYAFTVINGKIEVANSPSGLLYPYAYSRWVYDHEDLGCDWKNSNGLTRRDKKIKFGVVLEDDFEIRNEIYNTWFSIDLAVRTLNDAGGINGYFIIIESHIVKDDDLYNTSLKLINNDNYTAIFGCLSEKCRDIISPLAVTYKKLFFFLGDNSGESFSLYTIQIGSTIHQKMSISLKYTQKFYKNYYILSDDSISDLYYKIPQQMINEVPNSVLLGTKIIHSIADATSFFYNINQMDADVDHLIIITSVSEKYIDSCIELYDKYHLLARRVYFLFIKYNHYSFEVFDLAKLSGSFIPLSYHQKIDSTTNTAFVKNAEDIYADNFYVSSIYETTYNTMLIYKEAVLVAKSYNSVDEWPSTDYIRLSLINLRYQSPSGYITVLKNNYAQRPMYLMLILGQASFLQIYPELGYSEECEPKPYINGTPIGYENTKYVEIIERNEILTYICFSLGGINIIIVGICLYFTIKYRRARIIHCLSVNYHYWFLLGCFACILSIMTMAITPSDTSIICRTRVVFMPFALTLLISTMFYKTSVYRALRRKKVHKIKIQTWRLFRMFIVTYIIPFILTILYLSVTGSVYSEEIDLNESTYLVTKVYKTCTSNNTWIAVFAVYFGIFLFFTTFLSILTRKVANEFYDSSILCVSSAFTFILGFVLFALDYVIGDDVNSLLVLRGVGYQLIVLAVILLQYIPKFIVKVTNEEALDETDSIIRDADRTSVTSLTKTTMSITKTSTRTRQ